MSALTFDSREWSWAEVDSAVEGWAQWLSSQGVQHGSRVSIVSWNHPEMLFAFLACTKLGATFVPINARLTNHEQRRLIERANAVMHLESGPSNAGLESRGHPVRPEPGRRGARPRHLGLVDAALAHTFAAALFTSGTTGEPKLIELTHDNFIANAEATEANLGVADSWLCTLPLFHIGGLAMVYRWARARSHLALEAQFDAARVSQWLESGRVTHASLVPTALDRVLEANAGRGFSKSVRAVLIGGGPMGLPLLTRARALGLPVLQTYGLTEATSQVTTERPEDADGTTAGPPLPGVEVRIVEGEIQVRGPTVSGEAGRWLATGDLGELDSRHRLTVFSRRVDLIITGGENVYPAEVEAVLSAHPAVREVAVVPRADAKWGQVPVAFVVWRAEQQPILDWAREQLASFKLPRELIAIEALPRNANGKVHRPALVARLSRDVV